MPLYDLLCLSRPQLQYGEMFQLIKRSCNTVLGSNGVLVKVTNNSETVLAYTIKKTHGHYFTVRLRALACPACFGAVYTMPLRMCALSLHWREEALALLSVALLFSRHI